MSTAEIVKTNGKSFVGYKLFQNDRYVNSHLRSCSIVSFIVFAVRQVPWYDTKGQISLTASRKTHRVRCLHFLPSSLSCRRALGRSWTNCAVTQTHRRSAIGRSGRSPAPVGRHHSWNDTVGKPSASNGGAPGKPGQTHVRHRHNTQRHWRTLLSRTEKWRGITTLAPRTASWTRL